MNKLFYSVFGSFIILFIIWSIVGFSRFGPDLVNKHLDLYSMIGGKEFNFNFTAWNSNLTALSNTLNMTKDTNPLLNSIVGWFNNNGLNLRGSGWDFVLNAINALFNPIAMIIDTLIVPVFILIMVLPVIGSLIDVVVWVVGFIFNPIFI